MIIGEDDKWRDTVSGFLEIRFSDHSDVAREIVIMALFSPTSMLLFMILR